MANEILGRSAVTAGGGRIPYKWSVLTNTTLGMLMATVNASILIISLPAIFDGLKLDPLAPGPPRGDHVRDPAVRRAHRGLDQPDGADRADRGRSPPGHVRGPRDPGRAADVPLWAGIYLLPLTVGFVVAGPVSGFLSDRYGAKLFATGGLVIMAASFVGLLLIPIDFSYPVFAILLFFNGVGSGLFSAPNTTAVMNAVPADQRGVASGIRATFQNGGMVLSIGVFFSLLVAGLSSSLPGALHSGLAPSTYPPRPSPR